MIRYVSGTLVDVSENGVIVDNHGIGLFIQVPSSLMERLPAIGREVTIYTYFNVREDAMQLFGFYSLDDLEVFRQLITVSGIGPKGGLSILSTMSADDVRFAVLAEDAAAIAKAPGVGAKTAKKLIVELKDKLKIAEVVEGALERAAGEQPGESLAGAHGKAVSEAVEALVALGYSPTDAMKVIKQVDDSETLTTEELLQRCLKAL